MSQRLASHQSETLFPALDFSLSFHSEDIVKIPKIDRRVILVTSFAQFPVTIELLKKSLNTVCF